jgi:type IV pilus assembly protein PilQ
MSALFALWAAALLAGGPVTGVSIAPAAGRTQIEIAVDGDVTVRPFTMEGPYRLVVDLLGASHELPAESFAGIRRGGVVSVSSSQFSADVVRIVLELDAIVPFEVTTGPGAVRISLEYPGGAFQPWSTGGEAVPAPVAALEPQRGQGAGPAAAVADSVAQVPQEMQRITVDFRNVPVQDVLLSFAVTSGRTIIAGPGVTGNITANIVDQPWDIALRSILRTHGFVAEETPTGIIEVHNAEDLTIREAAEFVETVSYRINFARAQEVQNAITPILTPERGQAAVIPGTNTIVVTDIPRVQQTVRSLVQGLDVQTAQVTIEAKIIFVSRTDLNEFGITYDLKDSAGNQLNTLTPGAVDADGDGIVELPEETVPVGTNVVALGGNSVAALGNATSRVAGPTLTLLSSLLIGRHTLLSFVEALESSNLSEVQAEPYITVMDNELARIVVGEETPIRVIDASAGGVAGGAGGAGAAAGAGAGAGLPVATVDIQETGIILEATPTIVGDMVMMQLVAERSAPQLAATDAGVFFTKQNAETRVLVRDGETIVIGGLTVTDNSEVRAGIPLLMDLPLIGRLFRVTRKSNAQRDLIILVTPHIVRD